MTKKSNVIAFAQRPHSYHENVAESILTVVQSNGCIDSRSTGHPLAATSSIDESSP
jgi:hypothetical protein